MPKNQETKSRQIVTTPVLLFYLNALKLLSFIAMKQFNLMFLRECDHCNFFEIRNSLFFKKKKENEYLLN